MYANTLPLLKDNFDAVDGLILVDANDDMGLSLIANYEKEPRQLIVHNDGANWFNNDLKQFIESRISM